MARRKKIVTGYSTWAELRDAAAERVLPRFTELGGNEDFLAHLWEASRHWEGLPVLFLDRHKAKWVAVHGYAVALREAIEGINAEESSFADEVECDEAFAVARKLEKWAWRYKRERPDRFSRLAYRHYWCLALLPYLELVTKGRCKWPWIADWLSLFEPDGVTEGALRRWWKEYALKPMAEHYGLPENKTTGARSDREPLFEPAFEYLNWREGRRVVWTGWMGKMQKRKIILPDRERREYSRLIARELSFVKDLGWT